MQRFRASAQILTLEVFLRGDFIFGVYFFISPVEYWQYWIIRAKNVLVEVQNEYQEVFKNQKEYIFQILRDKYPWELKCHKK